jgi:hypothetical protein
MTGIRKHNYISKQIPITGKSFKLKEKNIMNQFTYHHVVNESNNAEALIRVSSQSKKAKAIAGSTFYERLFKDGKPDTLTDLKVNFLQVASSSCFPEVGRLIDEIGPVVDYLGATTSYNGKNTPEDVVVDIKKYKRDGYTVTAIAKKLGISRPTVYKHS